ncbi:MAG TPA: TIGR01777 family oxidoreductase [Flavisolibacter sp.]|nr:TIGR01777 family oxidoreductase [Flavisolibacter sp.]
MTMTTVLITGGTGMIGSALTKALTEKAYKVIILTRKAKPSTGIVSYKEWDVAKGVIDRDSIAEADYIIHLAGANVADGRWTEKRKKEIVDSRVKSGELLVRSLKETPNKVKAVISASAIGWYGPDPQVPNPTPFVETDRMDDSFLGATSKLWEASIQPVLEFDKRLVIFRIGIVLSNEGGAYAEFKKPLNFSAATILGNGKQVVSWIHIDDLVRLFIAAIKNEKLTGIYNAVAPNPVTNKELIVEISKQRHKLYIPLHVPTFALKIALGEMSVEVLKSATVSSKKLEGTGFQFLYPTITDAVKNLSAS